jgi:uncharacterized protein (TIGR00369 family)
MSLAAARAWLEACPFHAFLGIEPLSLTEDRARLRLPFDPRLTNNGRNLHGGIAAALSGISSRVLWLAAGGAGVAQLASLHVNYVSAAREDLQVDASLVRLGRNVCFARIELAATSGGRVADALVALRLRGAHPPSARAHGTLREAESAGPGRAQQVRAPFLLHLGFEVLGMGEGASRLRLPWRPELGDGSGFHEGALLALIDVSGAMSSHAAHGGVSRSPATISLQAQIVAPDLPPTDLFALGRCAQRDDDIFWNDVQVARDSTRELLARGGVVYRIASQ